MNERPVRPAPVPICPKCGSGSITRVFGRRKVGHCEACGSYGLWAAFTVRPEAMMPLGRLDNAMREMEMSDGDRDE